MLHVLFMRRSELTEEKEKEETGKFFPALTGAELRVNLSQIVTIDNSIGGMHI
jgi:hypothetical protein